jgi:hypothetical protein
MLALLVFKASWIFFFLILRARRTKKFGNRFDKYCSVVIQRTSLHDLYHVLGLAAGRYEITEKGFKT